MIDFSSVENKVNETISFFEREEATIVADTVKKRIIDRTLNGLDVNGHTFAPYVPQYAKYGRYKRGLQVSPVDLWALGNPHLLESIYHTANNTLWFPPEFIPMAQGLQAKRYFFGVNDSDKQAALQAATLGVNNYLRQWQN